MQVKIFDSELKIMEVLWERGVLTAGQLAVILKEQTGWNRNTTYTVIGKLVDKGAVERFGTNFSCKALVTKEQVRQFETTELINKHFGGSTELFLTEFIGGKLRPQDEIDRLKKLVEKIKEKWQI